MKAGASYISYNSTDVVAAYGVLLILACPSLKSRKSSVESELSRAYNGCISIHTEETYQI